MHERAAIRMRASLVTNWRCLITCSNNISLFTLLSTKWSRAKRNNWNEWNHEYEIGGLDFKWYFLLPTKIVQWRHTIVHHVSKYDNHETHTLRNIKNISSIFVHFENVLTHYSQAIDQITRSSALNNLFIIIVTMWHNFMDIKIKCKTYISWLQTQYSNNYLLSAV